MEYYVRHLAWLTTAPESKTAGRGSKRKSRLATLTALDPEHQQLELPEVPGYANLLHHLQELGFSSKGLGGLAPITFQEIKSWSEITGNDVTYWEATVLRKLSNYYCHQCELSREPECPPPWTPVQEITLETRANVDGFFRLLAKKYEANK